MPGGVNSPVRAFQSVGEIPLFIKKANGSHICMMMTTIISGLYRFMGTDDTRAQSSQDSFKTYY